ncbi:hypothetical protein CVT24_008334 [Panaeolus cyanescens]|uniref:Uncharacterized protein n=1 Tax=Panaeolus cyanescens TaxID=181874 RepID=A0A409VEY8_9AGAR|nr:hypothetical protein CVT24_008334 [Panaeolus cyanescens]
MSFNHEYLLRLIDEPQNPTTSSSRGPPRACLKSAPCLPERLPANSFIKREADSLAPKELTRQMLRETMEEELDKDDSPQSPSDEAPPRTPDRRVRERTRTMSSPISPTALTSMFKNLLGNTTNNSRTDWNSVQPFEIMKAIEDKNIMFLMEIRDKAFPLLLQSSGGKTPLVHAIRTGNQDVAIVLLGAFSRWINHLEDNDVQKPQIQAYLKALRVGLKLAINEGLAKSQSDLIASFMQTLVMSEGDKWVYAQSTAVARAFSAGPEAQPVRTASIAVRKFATRELGKAQMIAAFEDYVSNATADLLLMGAWTNVLQSVNADPLPSYYFARDDRVYRAFIDRLERTSHSAGSVLSSGQAGRNSLNGVPSNPAPAHLSNTAPKVSPYSNLDGMSPTNPAGFDGRSPAPNLSQYDGRSPTTPGHAYDGRSAAPPQGHGYASYSDGRASYAQPPYGNVLATPPAHSGFQPGQQSVQMSVTRTAAAGQNTIPGGGYAMSDGSTRIGSDTTDTPTTTHPVMPGGTPYFTPPIAPPTPAGNRGTAYTDGSDDYGQPARQAYITNNASPYFPPQYGDGASPYGANQYPPEKGGR